MLNNHPELRAKCTAIQLYGGGRLLNLWDGWVGLGWLGWVVGTCVVPLCADDAFSDPFSALTVLALGPMGHSLHRAEAACSVSVSVTTVAGSKGRMVVCV